MKKRIISMIIALCLCCSLCACGAKEGGPEQITSPKQTKTENAPEETPQISESEMTGQMSEQKINPVEVCLKLLCEIDGPAINCSLIAVNPDCFAAGAVNFSGASALIIYLLSFESENYAASYGVEQFGEKVFYLCPNRPTSMTEPAIATGDTADVRFGVSDSIYATGLLDKLLSDFQHDYGYSVSVTTDISSNLLKKAENGELDVVFTDCASAEAEFTGKGMAAKVESLDSFCNTFIYTKPAICGPADDPAGVAAAADDSAALKAIAEKGYSLFACDPGSGSYEALSVILGSPGQTEGGWIKFSGGAIDTLLEANKSGCYIIGPKASCVHFLVNGY